MTTASGIFDQSPLDAHLEIGKSPGFALVKPDTKQWPRKLAAIVVTSIIICAPIPLGSNHPLAWLFWATLLGIAASAVATAKSTRPNLDTTTRILFAFGFAYMGWAIFQTLPLPGWRGGISVDLPNGLVELQHLSIATDATFLAAIRLTSYLIFFWLALRISRCPNRAKRLGYVIFYSIAAHAVLAIFALKLFGDVNLLAEKTAFHGMATGTFINKNSFATFLGMGFVLGLALTLNEPAPAQVGKLEVTGSLRILSLAIILITLLLTQSRMGIAASLTASLFVVHRSVPMAKLWPLIAFFALLTTLAFFTLNQSTAFFDLTRSGESRMALYQQVLLLISNRPLAGFGIDSFPLAFELFHSPGVTAGFIWDKAHSTYLTNWSEGGLIFGSIPIVACVIAGFQMRRRSITHLPGQSLALAGTAATLLVALHSLVDFSLEIQANTFLFIAIIALGLGPDQSPKGNTKWKLQQTSR